LIVNIRYAKSICKDEKLLTNMTEGTVSKTVAREAPKAIFTTVCILLSRDALIATINSGEADISATVKPLMLKVIQVIEEYFP